MKKIIGTTVSLLLLAISFCTGQTTQPPVDSQPASSNVRGQGFWSVTTDPQVPGFHYFWPLPKPGLIMFIMNHQEQTMNG